MTSLASHYLDEIRRQLRGHKRMAEAAMAQLSDQDFFVIIDPEANSVAMLVQHIAGNARSRFTDLLTTDGEKPNRFRDREFELSPDASRAQVMEWWEQGWTIVFATLDPLKPQDLERDVTIRQEPHRFFRHSTALSPITLSASARLFFLPSTCARRNGRPSASRAASRRITKQAVQRA